MADYVGEKFHPAATYLFLLLGVGVFLSGVLGNGLLLVVLCRYRPLWQAHNVFIASLTVADLLIVSVAIPHVLLDLVLGYHPVHSEVHCRVCGYIVTVCFYVSLMSLVAISCNRYMRVCHGHRFDMCFSVKKNLCICLCLWVLSIVVNIPSLVGWLTPFKFDKKAHACIGRGKNSFAMAAVLVVLAILVAFLNFAIFRRWGKFKKKMGISKYACVRAARRNRKAGACVEDVEFRMSVNVSNEVVSDLKCTDTGSACQSETENCACSSKPDTAPDGPWPDNTVKKLCPTANKTLTLFSLSGSSIAITSNAAKQTQANTPVGDENGESPSRTDEDTDGLNAEAVSSAEKRLIRSLLVVSIVLFVLFIQYAAVAFVDSVVGLPAEVVAAATLLLCVNSAINWIIYGAMNTSYKQAYAQTLPCCKRCDQSSGGE